MDNGQPVKERLQTGFDLLRTVLIYRARTGSPGLGWGIERAVVDRELDDLEADLAANPPMMERPGQCRPSDLINDPLPLPSLRPYLKNKLKPRIQSRDSAVDDSDWTNA